MKSIICLIGIFLFPIFTLGCVLMYYDHYVLGMIALVISLFRATGK